MRFLSVILPTFRNEIRPTQIEQDLETRKFVDRAKAVLIKRGGLTEPEAHRRLQQESQKRRMSMGEVARRIVEADEILEER